MNKLSYLPILLSSFLLSPMAAWSSVTIEDLEAIIMEPYPTRGRGEVILFKLMEKAIMEKLIVPEGQRYGRLEYRSDIKHIIPESVLNSMFARQNVVDRHARGLMLDVAYQFDRLSQFCYMDPVIHNAFCAVEWDLQTVEIVREWRPKNHADGPKEFRDAMRTLVLLAKIEN